MMTAAIMIGLAFPSCTKIKGTGPTITEQRTVSNFRTIRSAMSGDVYIRQDSFFKVEVRGQQNILDILNTSVSGDELKIDFDYNKRIGTHEKVEVYISCPNVEGISLSGSGNIKTLNKLLSSDLELTISGSGNITLPEINSNTLTTKISGSGDIDLLNGWATTTSSTISGSGSINLVAVSSDNANVKISGSGDIRLNVQEQLDVTISGSGDVYYRGNPRIGQSISGSGKLHRL